MNLLKRIVQVLILIATISSGLVIGYFVHHNLNNIGVNFITVRDIFACYTIPTIILCLVGFYGVVFVEDNF